MPYRVKEHDVTELVVSLQEFYDVCKIKVKQAILVLGTMRLYPYDLSEIRHATCVSGQFLELLLQNFKIQKIPHTDLHSSSSDEFGTIAFIP